MTDDSRSDGAELSSEDDDEEFYEPVLDEMHLALNAGWEHVEDSPDRMVEFNGDVQEAPPPPAAPLQPVQ